MRNVIMLMAVVIVANVGIAQSPQRPRPGGLRRPVSAEEQKFRKNYPAGTNEFGRTWAVQCEYEKFIKENPSGRNTFGRSFDEQRKYEADEEAARKKKIAEAQKELEGWPEEIGNNPFVLSVNGTNIQKSVQKCLYGAKAISSYRPNGLLNRGGAKDNITCFDLSPLLEKECRVVRLGASTESTWERDRGMCMIRDASRSLLNRMWEKYDENGRLVKCGHPSQFKEYDWMTNRHVVISARLRETWAKKHGLTLQQAEKRVQELKDGAKPTRAEQRQQLQAIQEELKRVREAKAAEE